MTETSVAQVPTTEERRCVISSQRRLLLRYYGDLLCAQIQNCILYSFETRGDEMTRGPRLQERTRSRCLVNNNLVLNASKVENERFKIEE